jgi:methionyl-tRNA formyltransferase
MLAAQHNLPIFQPAVISAPDSVEQLRSLAPDVCIIAAYGQILKQTVLDVPSKGVLNIHASLLPRWRGAAPIPAAILSGDEETGATIMLVERKLDAGPMLASVRVKILAEDDAGRLTDRLAVAGANLLMEVLPAWERGQLKPESQDESLATYAPAVKKTDALIDWEREGHEQVWRKVRAYNPWPVAYSYLDGEPLRILECMPVQNRYEAQPGTIFAYTGERERTLFGAGFGIVASDGDLGVISLQAPGGKRMLAADYLRGHRDIVGKRLTSTP